MRPEAIFVVLYAAALLAGAVGLHQLGRTTRMQRAGRYRDGRPSARIDTSASDDRDPGWPRSEVPRFYTGMALVAAGASTLLPVGELVARDHRAFETAVLVSVILLAVLTIVRLGAKLR